MEKRENNKESIFKALKNEGIKIDEAKNYSDDLQKFIFWLDGVKEFAPAIIAELCDFIEQSIKNDTHPIDILMIMGSILNDLYMNDVKEIKMLESIKTHIEVLYPDNELNSKIEELDTCQAIRLGIIHWLKILNNSKAAPFIEPPKLSSETALPSELKKK